MVQQLSSESGLRFLLTPNRSLSWQGNVRIWLGLCAISLLISMGMLTAGAWVVLPFAGLEVFAVGAAIYYTARQCQRQEVLTFSEGTITLEKGRDRKHDEWAFPRQFTRLQITEPRHIWTPPDLLLVHRENNIPLASFLNLDDTKNLIRIIEREGLRIERRQLSTPFLM